MKKSGSCKQISFEPRDFLEENLIEFLEEYFEVVSCNFTEDNKEEYIAYENINFDESDFVQKAKEQNIELVPYKVETLSSENWLKDCVIEFAPVEIEDFLIYGIHEKEQPKTNKIPMQIYAATAFGSEHQTTKACIKAISELNKNQDVKKDKILDMGCGSGILAIATAMLWKNADVFAVDIDDEAVIVTEENMERNSLNKKIMTSQSNGYQSSFVQDNAKFDIIISNILTRPLVDMAKDLYASLEYGGFAILSGFVEDQVDWVIDAHKELGLKLVKIYEIDNWRAALLEK